MTSEPIRRVVIEEYDAAWPERYERERALIMATCGEGAFAGFEHVGSTGVPGLAAKAVIDIMAGVRSIDDADALIAPLASIGYLHTPDDNADIPDWRFFRKDVDGVRAFHVHMVVAGSEFWVRHLLFRNYLRAFPSVAREYLALKRRLADEYNATATAESSINDGYTEYKTEFVRSVERMAAERIAGGEPIIVVRYDDAWPRVFARERALIADALGDAGVVIEHVGSTAVPGLSAKPYVDIAAGVPHMRMASERAAALRDIGYVALENDDDRDDDWAPHHKHDAAGAEIAHLHMVPLNGVRWQQYLAFRNYLRAHREDVDAYAALKTELAAEYGRDRIGYTEAKSRFVRDICARAAAERAS